VDGVVSLSFTEAAPDVQPFFADRENVLVSALPRIVTETIHNPEASSSSMPLVLCGPSGSGKTLLVSGLLTQWKLHHSQQKMRLLSGIDFARLFANAVDTDTLDTFRRSFQQVGCICIEHIHVLATKPGAQREFCYLLDRWLRENQFVLLTSLVPPAQFDAPIFASRLNGGLVIPLALPNPAVLREILRYQISLRGWNHDAAILEVLFQRLSKRLAADFTPPTLIGAINQLDSALSAQNHAAHDRRLTLEQIDQLFPEIALSDVSLAQIWSAVAKQFRVTPAELRSSSRRQSLVQARGIAAYLARELSSVSLQTIGRELGDRDHSTISHVIEKTICSMQDDHTLANLVATLRQSLLASPVSKKSVAKSSGKRVASLSKAVAVSTVSNNASKALF
jgi:chromosomal replication initiator protein